jgi:hypothetical protein
MDEVFGRSKVIHGLISELYAPGHPAEAHAGNLGTLQRQPPLLLSGPHLSEAANLKY